MPESVELDENWIVVPCFLQNSLPLAETKWNLTASLNVLAKQAVGGLTGSPLPEILPSQLRVKESFGTSAGGGGGVTERGVTVCEMTDAAAGASTSSDPLYTNPSSNKVGLNKGLSPHTSTFSKLFCKGIPFNKLVSNSSSG